MNREGHEGAVERETVEWRCQVHNPPCVSISDCAGWGLKRVVYWTVRDESEEYQRALEEVAAVAEKRWAEVEGSRKGPDRLTELAAPDLKFVDEPSYVKCLRGEHEADVEAGVDFHTTQVWRGAGIPQREAKICSHCRAVFVPR